MAKIGYKTCSKKEKKDREAYFSELDKLTLEERIRKIEEWIYNYKSPVNINDILF